MSGTRFAWNSTRTNYFTQTFVEGRYVSACGTLYAERVRRDGARAYVVTDRSRRFVGEVPAFAGLGKFLDDIQSTINPNR